MALLMMQKGIALIRLILNEVFPKYWNIKASNNAIPIIENNAPNKDFLTSAIFDLLKSNSKEPSSTMRIRPIVANMGRSLEKSGISKSKNRVNCLMPHPNSNSRITEGMLVLEAVRLNI